MSVRYVTRAPSAALAPFVEHLWWFAGELPHARERVLPTGAMQLLVNLHADELRTYTGPGDARGASMEGAFTTHVGIDTAEQREICGVRFRPGGAAAFLSMPADELAGDSVALEDVWGRDGAVLRDRLLVAGEPRAVLATLDAALRERLVRPDALDPAMAFAVGALDRGARVGDVEARLGLSPRRFIARFAAATGLTPKRFARVRRFHRMIASLALGRRIDWAAVAAAGGFADQAHLIHEFRAFAGVSPTAYRPRSPDDRNHVLVDDD